MNIKSEIKNIENKKSENYVLNYSPVKLSPDRIPKPLITGIFCAKSGEKGWILVDTGAAVSMVNAKALTKHNHVVVGKRTKTYSGAGGSPLPLDDNLVDIKIFIPNHGHMVIKNAIVCHGKKSTNSILMGVPDIKRMGMVLNFHSNTIQFHKTHLQGVSLKMPTIKSLACQYEIFAEIEKERKENQSDESVLNMFESMINMFEPTHQKNEILKTEVAAENEKSGEDPEKIQDPHVVESDGFSTFAEIGDPCIHKEDPSKTVQYCTGCDQCVDQELKKILEMGHEHPPAFDNPNIDKKAAL